MIWRLWIRIYIVNQKALMSEVSKVPNTVLLIKDQRACQRCRRCETLYSNTNKGSKGYVCRRCEKRCLWLLHNTAYRVLLLMLEVSNVLCIQGPLPLQGGRLFIWAFHPVGLAVHHQSVQGGSFVNFLGLDNYKGDCRQDTTKGHSATR